MWSNYQLVIEISLERCPPQHEKKDENFCSLGQLCSYDHFYQGWWLFILLLPRVKKRKKKHLTTKDWNDHVRFTLLSNQWSTFTNPTRLTWSPSSYVNSFRFGSNSILTHLNEKLLFFFFERKWKVAWLMISLWFQTSEHSNSACVNKFVIFYRVLLTDALRTMIN